MKGFGNMNDDVGEIFFHCGQMFSMNTHDVIKNIRRMFYLSF